MGHLSILHCSGKTQVGNCKGPSFGCRHVQMLLYFMLLTYTYCMRSVLSVAIVAMNDKNRTSSNPDIPIYNWDNQSVVLSAFFWGYVILQIPVAQLGKKLGPKWLLASCSVLDSLSCLMIPTMAENFGSSGVMVCRFFQGLAQGGIMPLVHMLLGQWVPPSERSVMGTFSYAGSVFGIIISLPVTGLICSSWLGWPLAFYVFGALGLKWVLLWVFLGSNRPGCHKTITHCEKKYIESSLGHHEHHRIHDTPWIAILNSPPFWAVTLAFVGANWGSSILLTQTPTYLAKILDYEIKSNSILSAAPYLAMLVCSFIFSPICDYMINQHVVSRGSARKIFNLIGTLFPACLLTAIGFVPKEHAAISVGLLIINGGLNAAGFCSYQVNHMDLSPNHAGILMGITNSSTSIFSIVSPLIVQFIVITPSNQTQWRVIFITTACIYLGTAVFFMLFASGEVQPWNVKVHKNGTLATNEQSDENKRRISISVIT